MERFWSKAVEVAGCWEWQGGLNGKGYGCHYYKGKSTGAHRVAWELTYGVIPESLCVLHRCDNRKCVNPDHLFLGTNQENVLDCHSKGRAACRKGENNGRAKLTADDVRMIRRSDKTGAQLARELGVSPLTISYARRGVTWTEVA